jgi:hypothetical protein
MRPINGEHDKVDLELDDSIASEILKSLGLDNQDDNLNDAKLSLYNNDISLTNDCIRYKTEFKLVKTFLHQYTSIQEELLI